MTYADFFEGLTGNRPFPYQVRLGDAEWPEVIDIPTGLGKTAAVIVAWLHRLLEGNAATGRRLVYCLPMRVLVEQTVRVAEGLCERSADRFRAQGFEPPSVHPMLGGFVDERWEMNPDSPAILVGTQDMLLSRALDRGYAMNRYKWPIHFGFLNNDSLWVLDETQLMGVAVETSAQLAGLRQRLGTSHPAHTVWMSATLGRSQLATVDHPEPHAGWRVLSLGPADRDSVLVRKRTGANKPLATAGITLGKNADDYPDRVAELAAAAHRDRGGLTMVVVNRVVRAQAIYRAVRAQGIERAALVHSRFRPGDRIRHESLLHADGDRIVVATQAVEAGVDVSSRTLLTELAPWPSLVQRFGRCNRYGEETSARVVWLDLEVESDEALALPYEVGELRDARRLLSGVDDVSPERVARVPYTPPHVTRPVLRGRDLLDLFDTTPDLLGNDVDVSRYVRDRDDTDVLASM